MDNQLAKQSINYNQKVVLVTGGSRGIGAAIVKLFLENNYKVIIHYNSNEDKAREIASRFPSERYLLLQGDFTIDNHPHMLWEKALKWKGRIDVLINNAAIMLDLTQAKDLKGIQYIWDTTYKVNVRAVGDLCSFAIQHFKDKQGGIIINMASRASFRGDVPDFINYAASKGAIISLTRTIARGYAQNNILAYAIAPGLVETEMAEEFINKVGRDKLLRDIPLNELVPPEEVANITLLLASGKVRHSTGATFDINGASYVR